MINKNQSENSINNTSNDDVIDISDQSKMLWHRRLGHFYHDNLNKYLKLHNVKLTKCLDCKIAKFTRNPHNNETPKATQPLEVIHSDIIGQIKASITGKKYILTFVDEYTRKSWIFLMENCKDTSKIIINFLHI